MVSFGEVRELVGEAAVRLWWFDLVGFVARATCAWSWRAEVRDVDCQGGRVPGSVHGIHSPSSDHNHFHLLHCHILAIGKNKACVSSAFDAESRGLTTCRLRAIEHESQLRAERCTRFVACATLSKYVEIRRSSEMEDGKTCV